MNDKHVIATGIAGIAIVTAALGGSAWIQRTIESATIEVTGKERLMSVSSSDGDTKTTFKNFVYTTDETYAVKDSLWNWHFRAGTVYAQIPDGDAECEVVLSGVRWGFLSMYQNIISANCRKST